MLKLILLAHLIAGQIGVDPVLVTSVIRAESNWNPEAVSSAGARGLMQLMPVAVEDVYNNVEHCNLTHQDVLFGAYYEPKWNIIMGTCYLKLMLTRANGNVRLALAGYNFGLYRARTKRWPRETRNYVRKICIWLLYFKTSNKVTSATCSTTRRVQRSFNR